MRFLFVVLGIVKKDPKLPDKVIMAPPPQRTTESVFDQEDKAQVCLCFVFLWTCVNVTFEFSSCSTVFLYLQLLARLLKSARPEDLETANRLIKSTIKEVRSAAVVVIFAKHAVVIV